MEAQHVLEVDFRVASSFDEQLEDLEVGFPPLGKEPPKPSSSLTPSPPVIEAGYEVYTERHPYCCTTLHSFRGTPHLIVEETDADLLVRRASTKQQLLNYFNLPPPLPQQVGGTSSFVLDRIFAL